MRDRRNIHDSDHSSPFTLHSSAAVPNTKRVRPQLLRPKRERKKKQIRGKALAGDAAAAAIAIFAVVP